MSREIFIKKRPLSSKNVSTYLFIAAIIALVLVLIGLTIAALNPLAGSNKVSVVIDGQTYLTTRGATVSAVMRGLDKLPNGQGRLFDVKGSVIETKTPEPTVFHVNGVQASPDTIVKSGDILSVTGSRDSTESVTVTRIAQHVSYKRKGLGPIVIVTGPGRDKTVEITRGSISGKVASEKVIQSGIPPRTVYTGVRDSKRKVVALTFDDGPSPKYTKKILAILRKYKVKATFFELGTQVEKYPEITRAVVASGNQVALHAQKHKRLAYVSVKSLRHNIATGKKTIKRVTGSYPTYMRPPYGSVDGSVYNAINDADMGIALWSIDTKDWARPGVKNIVKVARKYASPGAVLLMHDGGGNRSETVKALPAIIKSYKKAGYTFVTIDEYGELLQKERSKK